MALILSHFSMATKRIGYPYNGVAKPTCKEKYIMNIRGTATPQENLDDAIEHLEELEVTLKEMREEGYPKEKLDDMKALIEDAHERVHECKWCLP